MKKLLCLSFFIVSTLLNTLPVTASNEHISGFKNSENQQNVSSMKPFEGTLLLEKENNNNNNNNDNNNDNNNNNDMFSIPIGKTATSKIKKMEHSHFRTFDEKFSHTVKDNHVGTYYGSSFHANDDNNDMDINVEHIPVIEPMDMNPRNVKCNAFSSQDNMSTLLSCDYMKENVVNNISIHCDSMPSFINNSIHKTMNCSHSNENIIDQMTIFRNFPNLSITMMFKCAPKLNEQAYDNNHCKSDNTPNDKDAINCNKGVSTNKDEMQITCTLIDEYHEEFKAQTDLKQDDNSLDFNRTEETNVKYVRVNEFLNNQEFNWEEQNKDFEDDFELKFGAFAQEIVNDSSELSMLANKIALVFNTHLNSQENSDKKEFINVNFNFLGNDENFKNILGAYNVQYKKNYDSVSHFKQGSIKGCLIQNNYNDSQSNVVNKNEKEIDLLKNMNDDLRNECNEFLQKYIIDDVCLYTPNNKFMGPVTTIPNPLENENRLNNFDRLNNNDNNNNDNNNNDNNNVHDIPYENDIITPPNGERNVFNEFSENINHEHNEQWFPSHESQMNARSQINGRQTQTTNENNENNNQNNRNQQQQPPRNNQSSGEASNLTVNKLLVNPKTKNRFFTLKTDSNNTKKSVVTLDEFYKECSDDSYTLHTETIIELIENAGAITSTKKKHWFSDETVQVTKFSEIQAMATLSENIENSVIQNDLKGCKLNRYLFNEFKKMQLSSAFNMALSAIVGLIIMCLFF